MNRPSVRNRESNVKHHDAERSMDAAEHLFLRSLRPPSYALLFLL